MHLDPGSLLRALEDAAHRYLLLLLIVVGLVLALYLPVPGGKPFGLDVNVVLVALIFVTQGLKMDFSRAAKIGSYLRVLGAGVLVAVVAYPLMARLVVALFGLTADHKVGLLLMTSFPSSLEAAMALSASAGGDPLTAVVLLTGLNLIGLASIPLNLSLWLGSDTPVSEWQVLRELVFYLFLPVLAGQALRRFFPSLPDRTRAAARYVPMVCIAGLVYLSCSREAGEFKNLAFADVIHLVVPSLVLFGLMASAAWFTGHRLLGLGRGEERSFLFVTSAKPMSLSVALWAVCYADHHPLAIFPILVFYVCQVVAAGFVISRMNARDMARDMARDSDRGGNQTGM